MMEFTTDILSVFDKKWALLTAGDEAGLNAEKPYCKRNPQRHEFSRTAFVQNS